MGAPILAIDSLDVSIGDKAVVKGLDLNIGEGEVHVLFGPNGSGKSTLLSAIMQLPGYRITGGSIRFRDRPIHTENTDTVARMGIGLSFQHPPTIHGVTLNRFLEKINRTDTLPQAVKTLNMETFLELCPEPRPPAPGRTRIRCRPGEHRHHRRGDQPDTGTRHPCKTAEKIGPDHHPHRAYPRLCQCGRGTCLYGRAYYLFGKSETAHAGYPGTGVLGVYRLPRRTKGKTWKLNWIQEPFQP